MTVRPWPSQHDMAALLSHRISARSAAGDTVAAGTSHQGDRPSSRSFLSDLRARRTARSGRAEHKIRAGTTGTSTAQTDASNGSLREAQDPTCRSHVDLRPALTTNNDGTGRTPLDGTRAAGATGGKDR